MEGGMMEGDYEAWEQKYRGHVDAYKNGKTNIGDDLIEGERLFGEKYAQAIEPDDARTHTSYRYVCSVVPKAVRDEYRVDFSVYKAIAPLRDIGLIKYALKQIIEHGLRECDVRQLVSDALKKPIKEPDWIAKFEKLIDDIRKKAPAQQAKAIWEKMEALVEG